MLERTDMEEPFFSIMMPAYNAQKYIRLALDSISQQSFADYEVIVVDDGSSDATAAIVQEYAATDSRIKFFQNETNVGCNATRMTALANMSGKYVAFLDSDDIWLPQKLEVFYQVLNKREEGSKGICVHSDAVLIDAEGNDTGCGFQEKFNVRNNPVSGNILEAIVLTNWINMSAAVVDRQTLITAGGFREFNGSGIDDWDMWVRFANFAEFVFIQDRLTLYRVHQGGISSEHNKKQIACAREEVYKNILKLYQKQLSSDVVSKVCYQRAANAVVLGFSWLARKYFFEAWVGNKLNIKALARAITGC